MPIVPDLLLALLLGGVFSVFVGKDLNWDLLNYHFYNAFALLHGRLAVDLYPAQLQTFFHPVLDVPFYLSATRLPDYATVFLLGMPFGIVFFALWKLFEGFQKEGSAMIQVLDERTLALHRVVATVAAVCGAAGYSQAGTTTGEWTTLAFVILAMWALFAGHTGSLPWVRASAIAGTLLGVATGLKLTAAIPAIGIAVGLPLLLMHSGWRFMLGVLAVFAGSAGIAFGLVSGPWMWVLYRDFGNPLFPFFNSYFGSPLIGGGTMMDPRFLPKDWVSYFSFPLIAAFVKTSLHSELPMRDPRLLIGSILSVAWCSAAMVRALWRRDGMNQLRLPLFLSAAFLATYFLWMMIFGIYRYAIFLEVLAIALVFLTAYRICAAGGIGVGTRIALAAYGTALVLTVAPDWGRTDLRGGNYFDAEFPKLDKGALVVILTHQPVAYLVPLWPDRPIFVNPFSNLTRPDLNPALQLRIWEKVVGHEGPVYLLKSEGRLDPAMGAMLEDRQMRIDESCSPLRRPPLPSLEVCRLVGR